MLLDADKPLPPTGTLTITTQSQDPVDVAERLTEYWNSFWQRDPFADKTHLPVAMATMHTQDPIPVQVTFDDVTALQQAIKSTRSATARGVDGWFADELKHLPFACIRALSDIFVALSHTPWQADDMILLTLPISKRHDATAPQHTRPITLMHLIYRVWSKHLTRQIIAQLTSRLPKGIIGFLPGRSLQQALIGLQHEYELSLQSERAPQWMGITLDIVKCFNAFPRHECYWCLRLLGLPAWLCDAWFDTIMNTTRYWQVQQSYYPGGHTTTGSPEGDPFSIVVCLAVTALWFQQLDLQKISPTAYADNLSWRTLIPQHTLEALSTTKAFLDSMQLQIDFAKTWAWSTQALPKQQWSRKLHAAFPDIDIKLVSCARELGYTLHYNRAQSRHTQRERHAAALARLVRLRQQHAPPDVKARLVGFTLQKALFGTECYVVGVSWLQQLRSKISAAMIKGRKTANSWLAAMLLSKYSVDPELFVLLQCLRSIRHFLWFSTREVRHKFFRIASRHSCQHWKVHGPAGALAYNLSKIGWHISAHGEIRTHSIVTLDLLQADWQTIVAFITQYWMKHIFQSEIDRPGWRHIPEIDLHATREVLASQPTARQLIAMYALTGAYMMAGQTRHFTDSDGLCTFCGELDSEEHRLLHCVHFNHVRSRHQPIVDWLLESDSCHTLLPFVPKTPHWEHDFWLETQLPDVTYVMEVLAQIETFPGDQQHFFYTDGSCLHPQHIGYRVAGFAAVWHPPCTPEEACHIAQQHLAKHTLPDSFLVVGTGPCVGRQTVARAELQAVIGIAQLELRALVHTDSQYVIDATDRLGYICDIAAAHKWANFDNLQALWYALQTGTLALKKVKAHAWTEQTEPLTTFHRMGNAQADCAAGHVVKQAAQVSFRETTLEQHQDFKQKMHDQLQLRFDLHLARSQRQQETHPAQVDGYRSADTQRTALVTWEVGRQWDQHWPANMQHIYDSCLWGTQHVQSIHQWWTMLQWGDTDPALDPGISWYELAVNYQLVSQQGLAINAAGPHEAFFPRKLHFHDLDIPYTYQVFSFERTVSQLFRLAGQSLPAHRRKHCRSTRILGLAHGKAGLACRPWLPRQEETINIILRHFSQLQYGSMPGRPDIPVMDPMFRTPESDRDVSDLATGWTDRHCRFRHCRKAVR
eukprot:Skav206328  [mRNA]  locus=scaffold1420:236801:240265:+ [translate_table: standard]